MKLHREILRLAGPSILANITVPLVGMVDIAIAGHLSSSFGSAALIGGISVGTMLFDLLYWNFAFLRSGTGGLTAQAYGAGETTGPILLRALRIA
nr:MATE family efflux transporter [Bacteroidales bacterium]